jgi:2-polyprenyl-3-methyl-5-hydroxy-6-metoxy-1,4-benzoquinol methylase
MKEAENAMQQRGKIAEQLISNQFPELLNLFLTYQNEALAARRLLHTNLVDLKSGSEILEIGGGIVALATQLASEGFRVTSVEPIGEGFTGISSIMQIFLDIAKEEGLELNLIQAPIEECSFLDNFDFIFSINVMEHLSDPYSVLLQMEDALKPGGTYRFFCPNYDFPYEPHFGKWIFARKNQAFYLKPIFLSASKIDLIDSFGLYQSINYLTLRKLSLFSRENGLSFKINKNAFHEILIRSIVDSGLQDRHTSLYKAVLILEKLGLLRLAKYFPPSFQPIIDISIVKIKI